MEKNPWTENWISQQADFYPTVLSSASVSSSKLDYCDDVQQWHYYQSSY